VSESAKVVLAREDVCGEMAGNLRNGLDLQFKDCTL
jgi:hypothetical protein